jgi:hypothetical protein
MNQLLEAKKAALKVIDDVSVNYAFSIESWQICELFDIKSKELDDIDYDNILLYAWRYNRLIYLKSSSRTNPYVGYYLDHYIKTCVNADTATLSPWRGWLSDNIPCSGDLIVVPKGAYIETTHPGGNKLAGVTSTKKAETTAHYGWTGQFEWAGTGGYWHRTYQWDWKK